MRHIFFDIGAYKGQSVEYFLQSHTGYEIFSFECDRNNIAAIKAKKLTHTLIEAAAWTFDGKVKYYYGRDDGGTMFRKKRTGLISEDKWYMVECVDIARFIKENFCEKDYIIVKMNCEGCEYQLIPHLKESGLISWINEWRVNWHWNKILMSRQDHERVFRMIPKHKKWLIGYR